MNNVKPIIFLLPAIALVLSGVFYFILWSRSFDKKLFRKYIIYIIIIAFCLHLAWELLQLPLYYNSKYDLSHIAFCGLASIADVIMTLLLYFTMALLFKNNFWAKDLKLIPTVVVMIIGATGAILSERRHLSIGTWIYDDSMPLIPIADVGISPVLQFMILPIISYLLSIYFLRKKYPVASKL